MVGGITACWILSALLPGSANINLSLGANTNVAQGLFIEMFATITLVLNVLMLGAGTWATSALSNQLLLIRSSPVSLSAASQWRWSCL
jgi:hypothetical protein